MRRLLSFVGTLFLVLTLVLPTAGFGQEATPTIDSDGMVEVELESTPDNFPNPETPEVGVVPTETSETPVLTAETPKVSTETPEATDKAIVVTEEPAVDTVDVTPTVTPVVTVQPTEEATSSEPNGSPEMEADGFESAPDQTTKDETELNPGEDNSEQGTDSSIQLTNPDATPSSTISVAIANGPVMMTASPASGLPGTRVSVTGSNFTPGERVNIRWASSTGSVLGYKYANSNGAISGAILVPANASAGSTLIYLQSGSDVTSVGFSVTAAPSPTISVSPTTALPGARVSVTGTNFKPGERVNIRWGSTNGTILGYKYANSNGAISGAILVPANASAGTAHIHLQSPSRTTSVAFTVKASPAPTMSVSPTTALPGARVSVTGNNFKPGERVNIRWGSANGTILGYKNAANNGAFSGAILVPANASAGATRVYLQSSSGTTSVVFTVKAQPRANVSISENYVTQGDIISIQGWNFRPGETVTITLPGNITLGRVTVRSNGTFSGRIKIPATLPAGYHTITSRGGTSNFSAGIRVEVWGYVSTDVRLNPSSGAAGSVMRFTGSGFQPGERVTISWQNSQVLGTVTATPTGTVSGAVTIPRTATSGNNSIWFRGQTSDQYDLQFFNVTRTLNPTATVSPTSAKGGDIVRVTGNNFRPGEAVTIYWGKQFGPTIGVVTASSNGSISGRVTIPRTALAGNHSIVVVGNLSYSPINKTIRVTASPVAKVTLSSTSGPANHIMHISGSGFGPNEIVQITWGSVNGESIGIGWTDQNGVFADTTILTPWDSNLGTYRIYAVGERSKRTTSTTYTVTRTLIRQSTERYAHNPVWHEHIQTIV